MKTKHYLSRFMQRAAGTQALNASRAAVMLLVMMLTATTAWADSPWEHKGSGTADDPYQISTAQQWKYFAAMVNQENGTYGNKCYKLTADITVTGTWSDAEKVYVGAVESTAFRGTFDGGGYTLTFNFQTNYDCGAPFRYINGATISNLRVAGEVDAVLGAHFAAGIANHAMGSSSISGCTVSSTIYSSGNGSGRHGGLVGRVESGATLTVSNCTFSGSFTGSVTLVCGGFVGYNEGTVSITDCLCAPSTVDIAAMYLYSFCRDLGGGSSTLTRAYRTFDSHKNLNQGTRVYTEAPATPLTKRAAFGGTAIYVDGGAAITGVNDAYGYTGSSLALPTAGVTFDGAALAAAHYDVVFRNSSNAVVSSLAVADTYTVTATGKGDYAGSVSKTFTVTAGDGSQQHPYPIGTPAEWNDFAAQVTAGNSYSGKYVRLTADISVATMAGDDTHSFNGTFLGGGHTLTVDISDNNYVAPFRSVNGATLSDLTVAGCVSSNGLYAATFVAASNGNTQFTNCHSTATLNSTRNSYSYDGGFVGANHGTLTFDHCSFKGRLLGAQTYWCGGFVGWNQNATATFTDCLFAPAEVTMGTNGSGTFVQTSTNSSTTFTRTYYTTGFGAVQGTKVTAAAPDGICKMVVSAADGATYYDKVCSVSGIAAIYPLGADPVHPEPVVKDGSTTLTADVDYVLHWDEMNAAEGDYTLTVAGIGSYTGSATVGYTVQSSTGTFGGQTFVKGTDGDGDYFVIATGQDLRNLATAVNAGNRASGVRFVQTADIDLSSGGNFTPIGLSNGNNDRFYGTYDGGHHAISSLTVSTGGMAGLFGSVYGTVRNVRLASPSITSGSISADVGTISAGMGRGSTVENCLVISPSVSGGGADYRGAIVGSKYDGTCRNCYFYGGNQDKAFGSGSGTNVCRVYKVTLSKGLSVATAYSGDGTDGSGARISSGTHAGYYAAEGTTVTFAASDGYSISSASYDDGSDHVLTAGADGKYSFTMPAGDVTVTAVFYDPVLFGSDIDPLVDGSEKHPYIISTAAGWNQFCEALQYNDTWNRFIGKTIKLGSDIAVTRMAGSEGHEFCGTFDGDGHKITVSYGSSGAPLTEDNVAPFRYAGGSGENVCDFKNLRVDGTIYTAGQFAAGFVAQCNSQYFLAFRNCRSSVTINSSHSGDGTHGGFVGLCKIYNTLYFYGCLFDGSFIGTSTEKWGGFVGWRSRGNVYFYQSIFAPATVNINNTGSATFCRNGTDSYTRAYYTQDINDGTNYTGQGYQMHSITPGEKIAFGLSGYATKYNVSGITNYGDIYRPHPGLQYGDTYYAGSGEAVSITLSTTNPAYVASSYSVSNGGKLSGNDTNGWTLTMPDADVTISANYTIDTNHFAQSGSTYTVKSAEGWGVFCDLLASNAKGYFSGKTVRLGADIGTADDPVTSMAGTAYHDFTGTFDGQGHTLTVGYGTADAPFGEEYAAPFRYLQDGCTIKNLHVAGHIYTAAKNAAGLAGSQYGDVTIQNCRSSVTIVSSVENANSDGTHGGFIALFGGQHKHLSFEGCVFDGKLLTTNGISHCGGFVGWANGTSGSTDTKVTFTNCLYAPGAIADGEDEVGSSESATFARKNSNNNTVTLTFTNCYYTRALGTAQGLGYSFANAPVNIGTAGTAYNVSGITPYTRGMLYGGRYYMTPEAVSLADNAANDVTSINGYFADVTLQGRTLYKDGAWNTLCLPFDVTVSGSVLDGDGVDVRTLDSSSYSDGTLTLGFTQAEPVIEAGKPYIVRWASKESPAENLVNPVFTGVNVNNALADVETNYVDFIGTISPTVIYESGEEKTNLYFGDDNKLYYPIDEGFRLNACRSYFKLKGVTVNGNEDGNGVRCFYLNFGDETMGIDNVQHSTFNVLTPEGISGQNSLQRTEWYTIDGVKLSGKPTKKGMYIYGGHKVVIK